MVLASVSTLYLANTKTHDRSPPSKVHTRDLHYRKKADHTQENKDFKNMTISKGVPSTHYDASKFSFSMERMPSIVEKWKLHGKTLDLNPVNILALVCLTLGPMAFSIGAELKCL